MHTPSPRLARKAVCAAVAVPALFVTTAGCSSGSSEEPDDSAGSSKSSSPSPSKSVAPVKFAKLPDPCKTISEKTVEDIVPGAEDKSGKALSSSDTERYGSCLWSGGHGDIDAKYRALTVSFKRYENSSSLGPGDKQAERFYTQTVGSTENNKKHEDVKRKALSDLGGQATSLGYTTTKDKEKYRVNRVVVLDHNVVITVDYEGAGFEDADPPSAKTVRENATKAAKEAVKALEK